MALSDGVLYALVGEQEPLDAVKRWRRTAGGRPWNEISDGYNAKDPPNFDMRTWNRQESFDQRDHAWGFSKTLLAIDPRTKKILWCHRKELPIDSRTLCMKNGRIYFSHFSRYIVCLNAQERRRDLAQDGRERPGAVQGHRSLLSLRSRQHRMAQHQLTALLGRGSDLCRAAGLRRDGRLSRRRPPSVDLSRREKSARAGPRRRRVSHRRGRAQ